MRRHAMLLAIALLLTVLGSISVVLAAAPVIQEDSISFNWQTAAVKQINGSWKVVDGNMWMLDYGANEANARKALAVIKFYKMNSQCFVGRPNAPMQYYLVNGAAPVGAMPGEDAVSFNNANVEAKLISGSWKVVDGNHWMLDFAGNEANARKAVAIIKKYGFSYLCFVGRPNAPMMYFRADPPRIEAKLTAVPARYTAALPAVIQFKGVITSSVPTDVKYTFTRSDGATAPTYTLRFDQAGAKEVSTSWTIGMDYVGWEAIKVISPVAVVSGRAAFEIKAPAIQEDCISFNWQTAAVKQINGSWKVVDGNMWMLDYGANEANARKALAVIKFYKMNSQCFVGRPNAPMQYYRVNGAAPVGAMPGEDAISFNNANVEAKLINGSWKVVDGNHWMLDFAGNEANARKAVAIIKKYGFSYLCFVGRPNAPMMYFRR